MAYQAIGRGTSANDGTGDDLRTGAGKLNANFVEIYTYLGDGSALSSDAAVTETATQTLTNKTITGTFTGNITGNVTGNVTGDVTGDLTGDVTGDVTGNVTGDVTGDVTGNLTGDVTGNADTATALATARTIAGQSFDGSANITIAAQDLSDVDQDLATTDAVQFTGVTSLGDGASATGSIIINCETNAHGQTIVPQPHSEGVTNTLTLPAGGDQELVGTDDAQTLTNKTLTSPTITGTGAIAGTFTGNITGDVTGNVTGNVDGIVGGTTPAAGTFTDVTASGAVQLSVHADAAARDAAITSPSAGMMVFVTDGDGGGTAQFHGYDGSAWVSLN